MVQANLNKKKTNYSAPALEKGLDIIELLSSEPDGLRANELAERLKKTYSELFRMLVVLEQRSFIECVSDTDKFKLSIKFFSLANRFTPLKKLHNVSSPTLRELAFEIEQSCHIVAFYSGEGHVVVQQDPISDRIFSVRLGSTVSMLDTCSGKIILSNASDIQKSGMLKLMKDKYSSDQINKCTKSIQSLKKQSLLKLPSKQVHGVCDIGYPVFDSAGEILAALVVPFMEYLDGSNRLNLDLAGDYVRKAAEKISYDFGYEK